MNILFAGAAEVPAVQIKALLDDFINAQKNVSIKTQGELCQSLKDYLGDLSDTNVDPSDLDATLILAWDDSPLCKVLLKKGREKNIPVLDLTDWLDEMFLYEEDVYRCE